MSIRPLSATMIPGCDSDIPARVSRARQRSGTGLQPNGSVCAFGQVRVCLVGRSDGGGHANDVRRHLRRDNRAREADVAMDRRVHPWSNDGYEPKMAFEVPILGTLNSF